MNQTFIYHTTTLSDWKNQKDNSCFTNPSLLTEGFIHCSKKEQVTKTVSKFFKNILDVLILKIDVSKLSTELKIETPDKKESSDESKTYPHIYGEINKNSIMEIIEKGSKRWKEEFEL